MKWRDCPRTDCGNGNIVLAHKTSIPPHSPNFVRSVFRKPQVAIQADRYATQGGMGSGNWKLNNPVVYINATQRICTSEHKPDATIRMLDHGSRLAVRARRAKCGYRSIHTHPSNRAGTSVAKPQSTVPDDYG